MPNANAEVVHFYLLCEGETGSDGKLLPADETRIRASCQKLTREFEFLYANASPGAVETATLWRDLHGKVAKAHLSHALGISLLTPEWAPKPTLRYYQTAREFFTADAGSAAALHTAARMKLGQIALHVGNDKSVLVVAHPIVILALMEEPDVPRLTAGDVLKLSCWSEPGKALSVTDSEILHCPHGK